VSAMPDRIRVCMNGVENCCMPGFHLPEECHTPEMIGASEEEAIGEQKITSPSRPCGLTGLKRKLARYEHDGEYDTAQENKAYRDGIDEALDKINEFEAGLKEQLTPILDWLHFTDSEHIREEKSFWINGYGARLGYSKKKIECLLFVNDNAELILRRILGGETAAGGGSR